MVENPIHRVLSAFLSILWCLATGLPVAQGQEGYALEVSGGTVTINDDQDVLRLGSYTYEFWIKDLQGPTGSWRNVFCKGSGNSSSGRGPLLALRPNEQGLHYDHSTGSGQSTLNVMDGIGPNEWIHVALVLTALDGDQRIYVNGVQEATRASAGLTDATQEPVLQMGMGANAVLDDFRVWNYARTEAEVQEHMAQELEGNEEGLVGYWKFNEGTGTIAYDSSPSEMHGTIADPVWRMDGAPVALAAPPEFAHSPFPAHEAVDVPLGVELAWKPGQFAHTQDVYLGTTFNDVNDASRADPRGALVSQGQSGNAYDPASPLDLGQTYYWRVDTFEADGVTMHKGAVWSFTVEPVAYAVANVVATSNGVSEQGGDPENAVNESGLNEADQHSVETSDMWLATPNDDEPLWIQFEFDKVYKLHELLVWNYNSQFEPVLGFGLKDVTIDYSADGLDWIVLGNVEFARSTAAADYVANTVVDLEGIAARFVRLNVDGGWGMTGQYGLSEVRFTYIPAQAREPQPDDGATDVDPDTTLSWRAGRNAMAHEVHLGVNPQELPLVESVSETTLTPDALNFGTTYYWRVDAISDEVWTGDLWSFATQEYQLIDDFESYDSEDNAIYNTWIDGWVNGTGSTAGYLTEPFAETTIVNSGAQSMPLIYDNSISPSYSEVERDLGGLDLDAHGADTLRLFVAGQTPAFVETDDGAILMSAIGADIWNTADEFRYAYMNLSGDGSIVAQVDGLYRSNEWVKGGVMIRESVAAGSTFAAVYLTADYGVRYQARLGADIDAVSDSSVATNEQIALQGPVWVKIERVGNAFNGYYSTDGENWTLTVWSPQTITMAADVTIGLALTSHDSSINTGAAFSGVATTGNVSGGWQTAEIGVPQPTGGNSIEPLYVALEDSAGKVAVVTHANAAAAGISAWQKWLIPYSDLAGINLNNVSMMYIGVGDRNSPTSGGAGTVYVDDIGFGKAVTAPQQ